jgi:hypothetical protein
MTHLTKNSVDNDQTSWREFLDQNPEIENQVKYTISFNQVGECISLDTTNQKIITWATSRGLHSE